MAENSDNRIKESDKNRMRAQNQHWETGRLINSYVQKNNEENRTQKVNVKTRNSRARKKKFEENMRCQPSKVTYMREKKHGVIILRATYNLLF